MKRVKLLDGDLIRRMGGVFQTLEDSVSNSLVKSGKAKELESVCEDIGVTDDEDVDMNDSDDNIDIPLLEPYPGKNDPIFDI
jgi:hypothetical protein